MKNSALRSCGQLSPIDDGKMIQTAVCHCFECQKRIGGLKCRTLWLNTAAKCCLQPVTWLTLFLLEDFIRG